MGAARGQLPKGGRLQGALDDYLARAAVQDDSSDDEDAELSTYDEWFALVAGALPAWKLKEDPNWVNALREVSQGQFGKLGWQPFFHCRAEQIKNIRDSSGASLP